MRPLLALSGFALRQFLFGVLALAAGCAGWTLLYLALLLIAVIGNYDVGGPLAYLAGIILILITGSILIWGIFAPACGMARLAAHLLRLKQWAALPIAFIFCYLGFFSLSDVLVFAGTDRPPVVLPIGMVAFLVTLPLGLQWGCTEGAGVLFQILRRSIRRFRSCAKTACVADTDA